MRQAPQPRRPWARAEPRPPNDAGGGGNQPEASRWAQRQFVAAIMGNDFKLAMDLVPESPAPSDVMQIQIAQGQSSVALTTLVPPQPGPQDNAMAHVPVHMQIMGAQIEAVTQGGGAWSMKDRKGFEALAAHDGRREDAHGDEPAGANRQGRPWLSSSNRPSVSRSAPPINHRPWT